MNKVTLRLVVMVDFTPRKNRNNLVVFATSVPTITLLGNARGVEVVIVSTVNKYVHGKKVNKQSSKIAEMLREV